MIKRMVEETSPRAVNVMRVAHDLYAPQMEKALYVWMQNCMHKDIPCTMSIIMLMVCKLCQEVLGKVEVQDHSQFSFSCQLWVAEVQATTSTTKCVVVRQLRSFLHS